MVKRDLETAMSFVNKNNFYLDAPIGLTIRSTCFGFTFLIITVCLVAGHVTLTVIFSM